MMKGVVFTEFLGFVGDRLGDDMVDDIIGDCDLPHGGAYTSVGTYAHGEMVALCTALSRRSALPVRDLMIGFGDHLSSRFVTLFPTFFSRAPTLFDFLTSVESYIHVEVRKLYPDAELPRFHIAERSRTRLVMDYHSQRRFDALALGLLIGAARHYDVEARIADEPLPDDEGPATRFTIDLVPPG